MWSFATGGTCSNSKWATWRSSCFLVPPLNGAQRGLIHDLSEPVACPTGSQRHLAFLKSSHSGHSTICPIKQGTQGANSRRSSFLPKQLTSTTIHNGTSGAVFLYPSYDYS
ncbi:unnamed protein product [Nesidiocoris tenuis]|uniref:Uncharacterized protein n=1 Tax=Nesidiocoris tenuis TaxID=355587 RepID=A0A6H5GH93_9HEMI|nr:unnamed protein product [Nesidiocoris tenuis]